MPDYTSPNVNNYQIPKANLYWTPESGARRHVGNAVNVDITPEIETLDHYSSRSGIRNKDKSVVTTQGYTIGLTLDEITKENLRFMLLGGAVYENTEGDFEFAIGATTEFNGRLEVIGSNDVGPKYTADFPSVTLRPTNSLSLIGEEFATIELEGEANAAEDGTFGTITEQNSAGTTE